MLEYDVVDVFAETPFAGNQLAVVHGAGDLPDEALLAIAREFNYSETTFPVPLGPDRYRTRIFTVAGELPFAGHPTLGTAWVLRERGLLGADEVVQECGAGDIGVRFGDGTVELSAVPRDLAGPVGEAAVAGLLAEVGLRSSDLAGEVWVAGAGLSFAYLPVRPDAVARAVPGRRSVREIATFPETRDPLEGIDLYAVVPGTGPLEVHSRVFVADAGVAEDPATGSAAAGLGIALHARGLLGDGDTYGIAQGIEIGRPSRLLGSVHGADGTVATVRVAGQVHPIARGELRVPTA
ncbi:PhzF family phenazine biosynthesis protein [Marmoricola sp. RAF53]|uniref:PhzF family phenazine biosynthesis protein n=1 Tax=Marmoricola sp. RAF53 TaxID=3233059 RepID=UPI003F9D31EF